MTLRDFRNCIEFNIEHGIRHAVLGLGAPGLGKSEMIQQIGEKYGYKVIDLRLAQMSEVEIGGLIYPNEDHTKTRWLAPEILPDEERDGEKTILLLDEITSCPKRVQVAAYQLVLDRRVGQYKLPEGTIVIALGNRETDDGVYVKLAAPLADRFEIHNIDVDYRVWKEDYAIPNGINGYVVRYLNCYPESLHTQKSGNDEMVFATPRSWTRVSEILNCADDISNPAVRFKIIGNIGDVEAHKFFQFCEKDYGIMIDKFIEGSIPAPIDPAEIEMIIDHLTSKAAIVCRSSASQKLSERDREILHDIVDCILRLKRTEFVTYAMKRLLKVNPNIIKSIIFEMDDPEMEKYLDRMDKVVACA